MTCVLSWSRAVIGFVSGSPAIVPPLDNDPWFCVPRLPVVCSFRSAREPRIIRRPHTFFIIRNSYANGTTTAYVITWLELTARQGHVAVQRVTLFSVKMPDLTADYIGELPFFRCLTTGVGPRPHLLG